MNRERTRAAAWAAALAAGTAAAFWPILDNGFVNWDDPGNIVHNPWLGRLDPAGLAWTAHGNVLVHPRMSGVRPGPRPVEDALEV